MKPSIPQRTSLRTYRPYARAFLRGTYLPRGGAAHTPGMANQNRHRAGSPIGGRYAPELRAAADARVQLLDIDEEQNQQMRSQVMKAAGTLTGHGTISASQQVAQMPDSRVHALHQDMLDVFDGATRKAIERRHDTPREQLAHVMGPLLGTGRVGAMDRMGAMSDADVENLLADLKQVWKEHAPSGVADDDPWGALDTSDDSEAPQPREYASKSYPQVIVPSGDRTTSGKPVFTEQEREDLRRGDAFIHDGQMFQRRREGVYAAEPYAIAVRTSRPINDSELSQIAGLTGYAYATTGGERAYGEPERVDDSTFILHVDTTKGRAYQRLDQFEEKLADTIRDGSPVRKTNRSGPGTAGTRLVDGIGENLAPEIFYDSVERD